ncbi:hypothetical protein R2R35_14190 [Anaerocolumna sp. AGMB13020]|uniref:hypothetical protein n=1 Tax=Anaerocolumna sp. AGMB13020 TaxID=3081750 RepID=UPI002952F8C1|nr:hypothetical protein [Anaerocolumna sp. AGMB13020]WOO34947.1 hypothetical protein R2R35_14190 [Anaerocolumna sp. AGMB13020]
MIENEIETAEKTEVIGRKADTKKKEDSKKKDLKPSETLVYCGPTIKGIVQQYAHFNNGIPERLKDYVANHKAVERLLVPIEDFVEVKRNLQVKGTVESLSYISIEKGE